MYKPDENIPPLFPTPPAENTAPSEFAPPKCALPLIEPLTEEEQGTLTAKPYRIMQNIRSISTRTHRNATIDNDDVLWTWGAVSMNQSTFGDETFFTNDTAQVVSYIPKRVMENVKKTYIGKDFSLMLLKDGRLYACGENSAGQCGTGKDSGQIKKPRLIMEHVIEAAAGHFHAMALQSNGDLWIWGGDYGVSVDRVKQQRGK